MKKIIFMILSLLILIFQVLVFADGVEDHENMAGVYKNEGKFEKAIEEYKTALALKQENDIEIMSHIATLYRWTRKFKQSKLWLEKIIEIDPQNREAFAGLENLKLNRGIHLMTSYGGWEIDYTKKAFDGQIFLGKVDWADIYFGVSHYERVFYGRKKIFGKVYLFPKYTTYLKFEFNYKNYNYPLSINPEPDDTCYDKVPSIEIELSHYLTPDYQVSIYGEYFTPNCYWDSSVTSNNYQVGGELSGRLLKLLKAKLLFAYLRDPEPAAFDVDKNTKEVLSFNYKKVFLLGGSIGFEKDPFESALKYIPNRDLDNSLENSYFIKFAYKIRSKKLAFPLKVRMDYIYDKYSRWSYLSGKSSKVLMLTIQAEPLKSLGLSLGLKFLSRPRRNDQSFFIMMIFKSQF